MVYAAATKDVFKCVNKSLFQGRFLLLKFSNVTNYHCVRPASFVQTIIIIIYIRERERERERERITSAGLAQAHFNVVLSTKCNRK